MFQRLKNLFKVKIKTLNRVEINASYLLKNLRYLDSLQDEDNALFPVLKSNAYGHGLKEVARILKNTPVPYICVDSFPEYQIVKDYAEKVSLIMGETIASNYHYYNPKRAIPVLYNLQTLQFLAQEKKAFKIHLFLNTGMNREGIQEDELKNFLLLLKKNRHLTLDGVMSHLATVDMPHDTMTDKQIARFKKMYSMIQEYGFDPKRKYIGNSAGMLKIFDSFFNARRTGIAFYGYNHLDPEDKVRDAFDPLKPALRVISKVISIQKLQKGESVGYGQGFIAPKEMIVASLPFGYHEGLNRKLSNKRMVKWIDSQGKKHFLPLIGMISMNLSSFDTRGLEIKKGDEIEIISWDKNDPNTIQKFALLADTIPYEALVNIDPKIRREIIY